MSESLPGTQIVEDRQLTDVLGALQVGIRKISMYGLSHSIVPKIAQSLSEKLNTILETAEQLPLVIGKNALRYQETAIAPGNAVIRELSQTLHRLNIIQLTFKKGLTEDAVLKFLTFILENRAKTFTQEDAPARQFHEEVPSISLQWVSFKDAITTQGGTRGRAKDQNIWQSLIHQAGNAKLPEAVRQLIHGDPDSPPNTKAVASAINALYAETGLKKELYETSVLEFLKHQASVDEGPLSPGSTEAGQKLGAVFSKLRMDVREQIFKLSMQTQDDQMMPLENFLSHMPPSLLPEVLQHMDLPEGDIPPPAYRLLKKVVSFSKENKEIRSRLSEKLQGHDALREELMSEKIKDRAESPVQDFSKKMADVEDKAFSDKEVDHQLALILLEILEYSRLPKAQSEHALKMLHGLLVQGIGEDTLEVLMNAIQVLLQHFESKVSAAKSFWRAQLKTMLSPEIVVQMLKGKSACEGRSDALMRSLVSSAGEDFLPVMFRILEVEKHLSTRKQVIRFLIGCGSAVIPTAISQLKNPQWFVVRNMLVILKAVKAQDAVFEVIRCVKHKAGQVRLAALQALEVIAPESDLFLDALGVALHDRDEAVLKTAVSMLISSRHTKATSFVSNLFLEAEHGGKWHGHQLLLLAEMEKLGAATWLPLLVKFRKGFFFMLMHWGRERQLQSAIRKAISEIEKKGKNDTRRPAR